MDIVSLHHLPLGGILSPRCISKRKGENNTGKSHEQVTGKKGRLPALAFEVN